MSATTSIRWLTFLNKTCDMWWFKQLIQQMMDFNMNNKGNWNPYIYVYMDKKIEDVHTFATNGGKKKKNC